MLFEGECSQQTFTFLAASCLTREGEGCRDAPTQFLSIGEQGHRCNQLPNPSHHWKGGTGGLLGFLWSHCGRLISLGQCSYCGHS